MSRWMMGLCVAATLTACGGSPCEGDQCDDAGSTDAGPRQDGGPGDGGTSCGTDPWTNYGADWFSANCSSCHGNAFASYRSVNVSAFSITRQLSTNAMPPGGRLPDGDKTRILAWFDCSMPE